jgi:uncharacterized protein (DUF983 family)
MSDPQTKPSPFLTGLKCRCPRCGQGPLFTGFLKVAPSCTACGLDLAFADSGDGPAIFIIFAVSPVIVLLAVITEALFHPHPMVHLALWIPGTIILCLALLRPFKGVLIALQYKHDAHQGGLQ